jgi:hypothetical protein
MLVTLAVERVDSGHAMAGGFAGILATLSHPDHALFYAVIAALLFFDRTRHRDLIRFLVPFVVLFVPYFAWRWHYYGDLMPNTFYAKSADKVYFTQGFKYLLVTIVGTGMYLTLPLAFVGGFALRRSFVGRYALVILPIYLGYVAKVGGDFMLGRFFVAALPFWFLLVDAGYRVLLAKGRWKWALGLSLPVTVAMVPITVVKPGELFHGVADERTYGHVGSFETMNVDAFGYGLGNRLYQELTSKGIFPKFALWCIGMSGYYSKLPIFDLRGLTSRSVAHLPIEARGRPGHEKTASAGLVVEAKTQLSEIPVYPEPYAQVGTVPIAGGNFYLVRYDAELVKKLERSHPVPSFLPYLEAQITRYPERTGAERACDLWYLEEYYFSKNDDAASKLRVVGAARAADASLSGTEPLLLEPREPTLLGYKAVQRFSFERSQSGWQTEGMANQWLTDSLVAGQDYPYGRDGRYVNTFVPIDGNGATGRLLSPAFVVSGELLTFKIGGGLSPDHLRVSLIVDERPVLSATGCNSDWMGTRVWNLRPYLGKPARLVIEDASTFDWGHLVVDEIVEWKTP